MVPQGLATRIGVNLDFGTYEADPYLDAVLCTQGLSFHFVGNFCRISFQDQCDLQQLIQHNGFQGLLCLLNTISKDSIHKQIHT